MRRIRKKRRVRRLWMAAGVSAVLGGVLIGVSGIALTQPGHPAGPPALYDGSVPQEPRDKGMGERLLLVVGGSFATQEEAEQANDVMAPAFGELQGYYVVPVDAFDGLRESLPEGSEWALVSAFRTKAGARDFTELAASANVPAQVVGPVVSRGDVYAGLGQESDPNGQGSLGHALPKAMQAALG